MIKASADDQRAMVSPQDSLTFFWTPRLMSPLFKVRPFDNEAGFVIFSGNLFAIDLRDT